MRNTFKKIGLSLLVASSLYGATPTTINFQGFLKDSNGDAITGDKSIEFNLYTVATDGTSIWTSTKTITVTDGVYSTVLGADQDMSGLAFDTQYYIGIEIAGDGEMTPRQPLTSSAYALKAKQLDTDYSVPSADGSSGQVLRTNGSGATTWGNRFAVTQYTHTGDYVGDGNYNGDQAPVIATCSSGVIIGGGCKVNSTSSSGTTAFFSRDYPGSTTTWVCAYADGNEDATVSITAYAICIE